jgi:TonB family protein
MRILDFGRSSLDGTRFLYIVTEYAEEDLSQILPQRPLSVEEASGMLPPAAEAISFLHHNGFVHGHIKPSNVMAVNDQLKLSTDGLAKPGAQAHFHGPYDAPEVASAGVSQASDVWSLGAMLVAVFTQQAPATQKGSDIPALPQDLPPHLREIARQCLRVDPQKRCSIDDLVAQLNGSSSVTPSAVPVPAAAAVTVERPSAQPDARPARQPSTVPMDNLRRSPLRPVVILGIALTLLFAALVLARGSKPRPAAAPAMSTQAQPNPSPPAAPAESASPTSEGKGRVLRRVPPDISQHAVGTIRGTIKVAIRLSVNSAGEVTQARVKSARSRRYFATRSLDAARQWKFDPPQRNGHPVASQWILRFEFSSASTQDSATQIKP